MTSSPYYVTTPIYYVNDRPHIGHAYSTVAADVVSRYQALRGKPSYFLTGLDEHGLKIERRAKEEELAPQDSYLSNAEGHVLQIADERRPRNGRELRPALKKELENLKQLIKALFFLMK